MTIKMLTQYPLGRYTIPAGAVVGLFDVATEAGLIGAKQAIASAAAVDWTVPVDNPQPATLNGTEVQQIRGVVSGAGTVGMLGNIGRRLFDGRVALAFDNTTSNTFHAVFEVPADFDAARVVLVNGAASTYTCSATCTYVVLPSTADLTGNALTWTDGTLPSSGVVPAAASTTRRGVLKGDWTNISNKGIGTKLLAVRVRITTSASVTLLGSSGDDHTNWSSRTDGQLVYFARKAGTFNANSVASGFTTPTAGTPSPIWGVEVACRGRVLNLCAIGDSLVSGRGTYLGEGYALPAAVALQAATGIPVFLSQAGYSGQATGNINNNVADLLAQDLKPDVMLACGGSTNDYTSNGITDADIAASRSSVSRIVAATRPDRIPLVLTTVAPSNPAASGKNFDATDTKRVAWNAELVSTYGAGSRGYAILDASAVLSGTTDGDGQVNMLAGSTTDNIHPNDTGNALLVSPAVTAIRLATGL